MTTDRVTIYGVELEVNFQYYKGFAGSREEPPEEPFYEVEEVFVVHNDEPIGDNLYDLLSSKAIIKIEEALENSKVAGLNDASDED